MLCRQGLGICLRKLFLVFSTFTVASSQSSTSGSWNTPPIVYSPIDTIIVYTGDVFQFHIPIDAFLDVEDGITPNLHLSLSTLDGSDLPGDIWFGLDVDNQVLYGLPLDDHHGVHTYLLVATDTQGARARMPLTFYVKEQPSAAHFTHEFSMTIEEDSQQFEDNLANRLDLAQSVASLFGDEDLSKITVTGIERGTTFYWTNNSLPLHTCPSQLDDLRSVLLLPDDTVQPEVLVQMQPYTVTDVDFELMGVCI